MHNVEIAVFPIARTAVDDARVREWLDHIGAVSMEWPQYEREESSRLKVQGSKLEESRPPSPHPSPPGEGELTAAPEMLGAKGFEMRAKKPLLTGAESVIGLAAKRCYMSFSVEDNLNPNVTRIRKNWDDYFDNILKSGHGSVLEHAGYTFAIEGVSRVFTGEMNRHRAGVAISEGSMRYIRYTDIPWWLPTSLRPAPGDSEIVARKKVETIESFGRVFTCAQKEYTENVERWDLDAVPFHIKKQMTSCLRRAIPMGVATGGLWTLNMRALRHVTELRTTEAAEEEIFLVAGLVGKHLAEVEPRLFADFSRTEFGCWVPKYHKV